MGMTLSEYQKKARGTAIYPHLGANLWYPALGLNGEAGEVAEIVKKMYRDSNQSIPQSYQKMVDGVKSSLAKELGDVLWYIAGMASELGLDLNSIAEENLYKLKSRADRGVLHGSGDRR